MGYNQKQEKKMLLEQFYNISYQIGELLPKGETDEVLQLISRKSKIINSILLLKEVKDDSFNRLIEKIKIQEEKNLEISKNIHTKISTELDKLNKNLKITNIYNNADNKGSFVDITE